MPSRQCARVTGSQYFTLEQAVYQTLYEIAGSYNLGSPNRLRDVMARSNTVISGSWALLVIFRKSFTPNDLDFYTSGSDDTGSHILLSFLSSQGYEVVTSMDTNYLWTSTTNLNTIRHIFKLAKPGQTATINVIVSRTLSELQPIFEFHSTLVMNFIAWYGFVCLHPGLTLQGRGIINHYPIPDAIIPCLQKYATRGFDLRATLDVWAETSLHSCGKHESCPQTIHNLHGNSVIFIPFDYGNILSDFVGDINWQLRIACIST